MTSEYWQRVWQLCEEARQVPPEQRADYVRANAPDTEMVREILSLLAEPDASVSPAWTSSSSLELSGGTAVRSVPALAGLRIGRYAIGELIGSGASGEVYSARDVELERPVAMKFLRPGASDSQWRVDWFLREARAVSALNHPGIITVHEVIQSESGLAIVMELVDGKPLRAFCASANSLEFVARCGSQVAHALAAAHGSGIIHRDIKPENIMVRADGLAKVLDFGLAQSVRGRQDGTVSQVRAGTLRYMSPEQAAVESLTPATDIYSFGLVLYELIAGRHPFPAATIEAVFESFASSQPQPPSRLRRGVPKALDALILRMLNKAPEARPTAREVAERLDQLTHSDSKARRGLWFAATLAAIVMVVFIVLWISRQRGKPYAPSPLVAVPLTATEGFDSWPDISPDGNTVVYGWGRSPDAFTHIYLKQLDQDAAVKLVVADSGARIGHPKWSSDGKRIYFKKTVPQPGFESIWSVGKDGRDLRLTTDLVSGELSSGIDCSQDGKSIIYADKADRGGRFRIFSLELASGQKTVLTAPTDGWGDWDPHYSPDGKQIAFKRVRVPGDDRLFLMTTGGGAARQLLLPKESIYGHAWLSEDRLLLAAQLGSVIHGLWTTAANGGSAAAPLFESGVDATMPAVSRNKIVWVNLVNDYNIYSVPVAGGRPVKRIASPVLDTMPAFAPDGRLAFVSRRSGSPEVWLTHPDGTGATRITDLKGDVGRPFWSPDGARIAFSLQRFGVTKIYVVRCGSGTPPCESPAPLADGANPTWSLDGQFLYFKRTDRDEIYKLPLSGGPAVLITSGIQALASHDGKWLYYTRNMPTNGRFFRVPLDNNHRIGAEQLVLSRGTNSANVLNWALAGDEILFWDSNIDSKFSGLRAFDTVTKRLRTVVEAPAAAYPAVSPDGNTVWYAQPDSAGGTLMVAERHD